MSPAADCVSGLPERLRAAMAGRSVRSVARASGVPRPTLLGILHGERKRGAYIDTIERLARATGADAAWLAFGGDRG